MTRFTTIVAFTLLLWGRPVGAHPLSQGALDVVVHRDKVTVRARVTVEEVTVTNRATTPDALPGPWGATGAAAYEQHAAYVTSHLHVSADGTPLAGGVVTVMPPDNPQPGPTDHAIYELEFVPLRAIAAPLRVELHSDVLAEERPGGASWEATYVVRIAQEGRAPPDGLLLTGTRPVVFTCDWNPAAAASEITSTRGSLFRSYFAHGVRHILTGYDHLLFVTALVLGASSLWELVKVVTAFSAAHTITLTLAALNVVHLSERVVEPLIAASIVFVAVENVLWPARSRSWVRLAVAFFFGLFHGLGFAGGLLDAMEGMHGTVILLAIAAFSIGVETGHQLVVIPEFLLLKLIRGMRPDEAGQQRMRVLIQRLGSAAVSLAGLFYLVVALRLSFGTT
jgi:hydrogenase/urease accessory protein HupE